jgi:hypothetical protein
MAFMCSVVMRFGYTTANQKSTKEDRRKGTKDLDPRDPLRG